MRNVRKVYTDTRSTAKQRKIPWSLTFEEWKQIWFSSGKFSERGRKRREYQMDRIDPSKGYKIGNVQIILGSINRVKDNPHGHQAKLSEQEVLRIRASFRPRIVTKKILANRFKVSPACIKAILCRRNWRTI